jgi:hypothetical protein
MKLRSGQHDDETYEEFSARYAISIREPLSPPGTGQTT